MRQLRLVDVGDVGTRLEVTKFSLLKKNVFLMLQQISCSSPNSKLSISATSSLAFLSLSSEGSLLPFSALVYFIHWHVTGGLLRKKKKTLDDVPVKQWYQESHCLAAGCGSLLWSRQKDAPRRHPSSLFASAGRSHRGRPLRRWVTSSPMEWCDALLQVPPCALGLCLPCWKYVCCPWVDWGGIAHQPRS